MGNTLYSTCSIPIPNQNYYNGGLTGAVAWKSFCMEFFFVSCSECFLDSKTVGCLELQIYFPIIIELKKIFQPKKTNLQQNILQENA